ncbi:MAG: hypothetical protein H6978_02415 [Gammaproteobacteria bacterium]|nr:hypothetical protein [Gammaproteobacteria bacterium]
MKSAAAGALALTLVTAAGTASAEMYTGNWTNTSFGSNGPVWIQTEVLPGDLFEITVDLGGFVFGSIDPPPFTLSGTINPDGSWNVSESGSAVFGDISASLSASGDVIVESGNLPSPGGDFLDAAYASGTFDGTNISLQYTLLLTGGSLPGNGGVEFTDYYLGTLEASLTPVPLPAGIALLVGPLAALGSMRRLRYR